MRDAAALPLLLDVMGAAGRHDRDACIERLTQVRSLLVECGTTKPMADVDAAMRFTEDEDWVRVWSFAWSATTGLTWAFPPDPSKCPPRPGVEPHVGGLACDGCRDPLPTGANFCPSCGQPVH